jgi:ketosteroid isomerase-like protein
MESRATIDSVIDRLYAARRMNDADAAAQCFHGDGRFAANAAPTTATGSVSQISALKGLFDAFQCVNLQEHCRIIDPPRAAVHWRGTFRTTNGNVGDSDILDIIEFRDGRVTSLTTFYDTAFAAELSA